MMIVLVVAGFCAVVMAVGILYLLGIISRKDEDDDDEIEDDYDYFMRR